MKLFMKNIQANHHLYYPCPSAIKQYCQFYHLPVENVAYKYGYEKISGEQLFFQSFAPKTDRAKGQILLLHGYYDHGGMLSSTIKFFIEQKFRVLTFDLSGHGLSTGKRGEIGDFAQYGESIQKMIAKHFYTQDLPIYIVAHSTGAAAATEFILTSQVTTIAKAIFICPLVRSYGYVASVMGAKFFKSFYSFHKKSLPNQFIRQKIFAICKK